MLLTHVPLLRQGNEAHSSLSIYDREQVDKVNWNIQSNDSKELKCRHKNWIKNIFTYKSNKSPWYILIETCFWVMMWQTGNNSLSISNSVVKSSECLFTSITVLSLPTLRTQTDIRPIAVQTGSIIFARWR